MRRMLLDGHYQAREITDPMSKEVFTQLRAITRNVTLVR